MGAHPTPGNQGMVRDRPPPGPQPALRLLLASAVDILFAIALTLVLVVPAVAVTMAVGAEPFQPGWNFAGAALAMAGAALATARLRAPATDARRRMSRAAVRSASTWGFAVAGGLVAFLALQAIDALLAHAGTAMPTGANQAMLVEGFATAPWATLAFVVLVAPVYEEVLFRRVLFGRFLEGGRPGLGVVLSSLAFGAMHLSPADATSLPALLALLAVYSGMGAALAAIYWHTRTLWAAVAMHATYNLASGLSLLAALA